MKRFIIDFLIAFVVIVLAFGLSGNSNNDLNNIDSSEIQNEENIENIKDYDGNLVNRVSFKINNLIQSTADYGFDVFKKFLKAFLE